MTSVTEGVYKTRDLSLAATLHMRGLDFTLERDGEHALFVFSPVTSNEVEDLNKTIERYTRREERVDPLQFMKEVGAVRKRLYRFLDGKGS
jgi:hypothetical protein